jgi:hypothetical protein
VALLQRHVILSGCARGTLRWRGDLRETRGSACIGRVEEKRRGEERRGEERNHRGAEAAESTEEIGNGSEGDPREIKTVQHAAAVHTAQVLSSPRATWHRRGLLIVFHVPILRLGIERPVYTHDH